MNKQIRIYRSFDEAAEDDAKAILSQSAIERLRETVELILKVYGVTREELKLRSKSTRITFVSTP